MTLRLKDGKTANLFLQCRVFSMNWVHAMLPTLYCTLYVIHLKSRASILHNYIWRSRGEVKTLINIKGKKIFYNNLCKQ